MTTQQSTNGPFAAEMVRQLRAIDSYGTQDGWADDKVLSALILTKERKREIPIVGEPDEITVAMVRAFYNAVSARVEAECGMMAVPFVHLSHEGFGRALVMVGKLAALNRSLRDVHRFGFDSVEKLESKGEQLVSSALGVIGKFPEAAAS